jgi:hypothetical protein
MWLGRRLPSGLRDGEPVAEELADEDGLAVEEEGLGVGVDVNVGSGVGVGVVGATAAAALKGKKPAVAATPK